MERLTNCKKPCVNICQPEGLSQHSQSVKILRKEINYYSNVNVIFSALMKNTVIKSNKTHQNGLMR